MSFALQITPQFGWVIASGVFSIASALVIGLQVVKARKVYNVPYPTMYSQDCNEFNCIQRGHQNTLETQPAILFMMGVSGLAFPIPAAALGAIWTFGRILYFLGYKTGDPTKRNRGMIFFAPGFLGLIGLSGFVAAKALLNAQ